MSVPFMPQPQSWPARPRQPCRRLARHHPLPSWLTPRTRLRPATAGEQVRRALATTDARAGAKGSRRARKRSVTKAQPAGDRPAGETQRATRCPQRTDRRRTIRRRLRIRRPCADRAGPGRCRRTAAADAAGLAADTKEADKDRGGDRPDRGDHHPTGPRRSTIVAPVGRPPTDRTRRPRPSPCSRGPDHDRRATATAGTGRASAG